MKRFRRLLMCSFFLGFLAAVGGGVFHFVRYRPRCTIENAGIVQHFSADGHWLVCFNWAEHSKGVLRNPDKDFCLRVYDAQSGRIAHSLPATTDLTQSPDGRFFVGTR